MKTDIRVVPKLLAGGVGGRTAGGGVAALEVAGVGAGLGPGVGAVARRVAARGADAERRPARDPADVTPDHGRDRRIPRPDRQRRTARPAVIVSPIAATKRRAGVPSCSAFDAPVVGGSRECAPGVDVTGIAWRSHGYRPPRGAAGARSPRGGGRRRRGGGARPSARARAPRGARLRARSTRCRRPRSARCSGPGRDADGRGALATYVMRLRERFGRDVVVTIDGGYALGAGVRQRCTGVRGRSRRLQARSADRRRSSDSVPPSRRGAAVRTTSWVSGRARCTSAIVSRRARDDATDALLACDDLTTWSVAELVDVAGAQARNERRCARGDAGALPRRAPGRRARGVRADPCRARGRLRSRAGPGARGAAPGRARPRPGAGSRPSRSSSRGRSVATRRAAASDEADPSAPSPSSRRRSRRARARAPTESLVALLDRDR